MAREEHPREDLLAQATALVERAELLTLNDGIQVVAGFRRDGSASFFFGDEPVYQFNRQGELRRAYSGGRMLKAEGGALIALERVRNAERVELIRQPLSRAETRRFLAEIDDRLGALLERMREHRFQLVGQVPVDGGVVGRLERWLDERPPTTIADSPRVG